MYAQARIDGLLLSLTADWTVREKNNKLEIIMISSVSESLSMASALKKNCETTNRDPSRLPTRAIHNQCRLSPRTRGRTDTVDSNTMHEY